ncbi:ATP-binding protein [Chitinophaga nivalis]|uniref:histidine kinase n=1 Tax=Chitinophaga nivalis TaxID=2991709 RepID=A0ABT3IQF8_9BACT|nr:ATP-binding protein [Chitinophaga nivalis]MCW3464100.1 ATP-binding protein [Chitinophaga nivalis]MCW3486210.1 ATP-binding protein [Chitinophaga nivalis]
MLVTPPGIIPADETTTPEKPGTSEEWRLLSGQVDFQQKILAILCRMHQDFDACQHIQAAFEHCLADILALTNSSIGIFGEVVREHHLLPYLRTLAITPATGQATTPPYTLLQTPVLQLTELHPLFGQVILSGEAQINNEPVTDTRHGGLPPDHPPIQTLLGLPITYQQQLTGMIGIANRPGGYPPEMIAGLQPLLQTWGIFLHTRQKEQEQRKMERLNTQLTQELDALISTLDDIVFEMDENKCFTKVWCNQESLLFRPKEQVIGQPISAVMGEHAQAFNRLADAVLLSGAPQEYEYPDIRQNIAQWYGLKMSLIKGKPSSPKRLLLLIRNITERKRKDNKLLQTQSEYLRANNLLNISQQMGKMGGWEFNINTGELYWTDEVYALREVPRHFPITFDSSASFYHPDDRPRFILARKKLLEEEMEYDLELRQISAKGKRSWVRTLGQPVYNSLGKLTHFRGIIMDISFKKLTELELLDAKDSAEKAARARSEFLSVMSHEIRTPLNAIVGISGLLAESRQPEHAEAIHSLQFSAHHLLGLINDILDFSKIETGKVELENIPFNPHALLDDIARNYQPLAKAKNIKLYTAIDRELPEQLLGDPVRLAQMVSNLVNNAIKFTYEGSVSLEAHLEGYLGGKCRICFLIKDTGIGIAPHMHEKIFDTFVQEDAATTRHHGGTGLGLAITRKLVELHKGHIFLESQKGAGATFRFTIGFSMPEQQHVLYDPTNDLEPDFLEGMQLLIVEDNAINIKVLQLQLKKSGATLTIATNGKQALQKMLEQSFDGIILDLHMPEMNGYETIPHIKIMQPHAFIIVLTADIMPEVSERLAALQVKDMLPKPYAAEDLYKVLLKYSR